MTMIKKILFLVFFIFSALTINAIDITLTPADELPFPDMPTLPTRPRAQQSIMSIPIIPVSVDLSDTDLYLSFTSSKGMSVVTIKDSNGSVVQREFIDTDSEEELLIPIDEMNSGTYTITIKNRNKNLKGEFNLQK